MLSFPLGFASAFMVMKVDHNHKSGSHILKEVIVTKIKDKQGNSNKVATVSLLRKRGIDTDHTYSKINYKL